MTYRDDRDADRARIEALEGELAQANRKIAELEGRRDQALVLASGGNALVRADPAPSAATRWLGGPTRLEMSRRFDGAFPVDQFELLIERIRELSRDPGRSELLRSSLTWSATRGERGFGPFTMVNVSVKDAAITGEPATYTTLTVTDRLGPLIGALYGGVGGGVGGGGLVAPLAASIAVPVLAPVFILGWLGGVFAGTRVLYRRAAHARAVNVQRLFDALSLEIENRLK